MVVKKEEEYESLTQDIASLIEPYSQSERNHKDTLGYVKITANWLLEQLITKGYSPLSFCLTTLGNLLNRLGYSLKKVQKTLPLKRIPATESIFENVLHHHQKEATADTLRISIDVKDKVKVGKLSQGGIAEVGRLSRHLIKTNNGKVH